ncbi:SOCS box domain-containing protein [Caerostris extrusa]|uniref:SOCS box domain-containing protein n=1 Tax=Caerostris extrusa TaxID=172846 RepID=A0AAV4Y708_CAEEX|nr:SOCS box domain-containing protein [Caerostris extrusa]
MLHEKSFSDSVTFLNIWRIVGRSSAKVRISVVKHLVEMCSCYTTPANVTNYVLGMAQTAHFDFWGTWFGKIENSLFYCPVTLAILRGNLDQMILFLRYGFQQIKDRIPTYNLCFMNSEQAIYSWLRKPLEERTTERKAIIAETILIMVHICTVQNTARRESMAKCLRLLWSVLPTPYITQREIEEEIQLLFQNQPAECLLCSFPYRDESRFLRMAYLYGSIFPEAPASDVQIRSLQHLSRCVIRRALSKAWNLPQAIGRLPLPHSLKESIQLKTDIG